MIVKKNKRRVKCEECSRTLEKGEYRVTEYKESLCPECFLERSFPDIYPAMRGTGKAQVIDIISLFLPLLVGEEVARPIILTLQIDDTQ